MSTQKQVGVTLVELMVGMVIGLLVVGVVATVYISAGRNFAQDQQIGHMRENAHYALQTISRDLEMVGFMGAMINPAEINAAIRNCTTEPDTSDSAKCGGIFANSKLLMASENDCGPGTKATPPSNWAFDVSSFVEVITESSASEAANKFGCLDESGFYGASDVLVIRRGAGQPLDANRADSADDGEVFIRTNGDKGMLVTYDSTAAVGTGFTDWRYNVHLYYVQNHFMTDGDQIPTLYRKTLSSGAIGTETAGVAQGIEYVHVVFGIDAVASDGVPEYYTSAPTGAELRNMVTAKVYVLVRSTERGRLYTNDKTYQMGDVTKDFSGAPDGFYRRVFSTTVQIRNVANLNRLLISPT